MGSWSSYEHNRLNQLLNPTSRWARRWAQEHEPGRYHVSTSSSITPLYGRCAKSWRGPSQADRCLGQPNAEKILFVRPGLSTFWRNGNMIQLEVASNCMGPTLHLWHTSPLRLWDSVLCQAQR